MQFMHFSPQECLLVGEWWNVVEWGVRKWRKEEEWNSWVEVFRRLNIAPRGNIYFYNEIL